MQSEYLPWARLLEVAYGVLHLSPDAFWAMTPGEWMAGLKGWKDSHGLVEEGGGMNVTREELNAMMGLFPDVTAG